MTTPGEHLGLYLHLARAAELRRQPLVRDRLLLLAGVIADQLPGLFPIAEACRAKIIEHNPGHMLARWPTLGEAREHEELASLVTQLARRYGPEQAEQLLVQLGIERGAERSAYYSDGEYAASLLGERWDDLERRYRSESAD
ncbi:MAG: hypothetical protein WD872_09730 [Pirellulaceae bacterium]